MQPAPYVVSSQNRLMDLSDADPRFRCCCGCMHARTGALVIGLFELIGVVTNGLGLIVQAARGASTGMQGSLVYGLICSAVTILLVGLMFYGIKNERAAFLVPHLVWQIIGILLLLGFATAIVVCMALGSTLLLLGADKGSEGEVMGGIFLALTICLLIIFVIVALLEIWFFVVILRLYRYYREKGNGYNVHPVHYTNTAATPHYGKEAA